MERGLRARLRTRLCTCPRIAVFFRDANVGAIALGSYGPSSDGVYGYGTTVFVRDGVGPAVHHDGP